jgi:hypothetical protein
MLMSGQSPLATDEEAITDIATLANQLRGTGRVTEDGSPEWFGAQALIALDRGDQQMAALAVSLGMLQYSAFNLRKNAAQYVPEYRVMRDIIAEGRPATPAMMATFSAQIEIASMVVDAESMTAEYGADKSRSSRRMAMAAKEAMARFLGGDVEGTDRILSMARAYADLLKTSKGKPWAGMEEMAKAIDAEINGKDGTARFNNALAYYNVSSEVQKMLAVMQWEGEVEPRLRIAMRALVKAEELAKQGNVEEAGKILTLVVMYNDSVGRLGERKGNRIVAVRDGELLAGMESTLKAVAQGKQAAENVFMESYSATQASYVEKESARLGKLAAKREIGRNEITTALDTANKRAVEGDFQGANMLLQYVRDYYGEAAEGKAEGWRYSQFATKAGKDGSRQMLQAIRMEMAAGTTAEKIAAAKLYDQGTATIASLQAYKDIQWDARRISDVYNGRRPLATGLRAGQVPMGEKGEDGTYETISMETVRTYESENPKDATLKGDTLAIIMDRLESAARRGDAEEYKALRQTFWERFALVASRVERKQTVEDTKGLITQAQESMRECKAVYSAYGEKGRAAEIAKLERKIADLSKSLKDLENNDAALPLSAVAPVLETVQMESRIAAAYGQVHEEMKANEAFLERLEGGAGAMAHEPLIVANRELEAAGKAMLRGEWKTAATAYERAVEKSIVAMKRYEAIGRLDEPRQSYETYKTLRLSALDGIITGTLSQEEVGKKLTGARIIEISVLTIPTSAASKIFTDNPTRQRRVKELVRTGQMDAAQKTVDEMQKVVGDLDFWSNMGVAGVGLLVSVIPGGQLAGGAIFACIAWDQVVTEYNEKGSASWASWAMLAAVPLTVGAIGVAGRLGAAAIRAKDVGATAYAARLAVGARVLNYAALGAGLGFAGYMGYNAYEMFKVGENAKGVALAAMALFPFAFAGGAAMARGARVKGMTPARAGMNEMLDVAAGEGAPRVVIEPTEAPSMRVARYLSKPQELYNFLKELAAADKPLREAMLNTLPMSMKAKAEALIRQGPIRKAIDAKRLEPDALSLRLLNKAIDGFDLPPKPSGPGGPRGRRSEVEAAGLLERGGVGELVEALLIPARARAEDPAAAVRYNVAKQKLETIRAENPQIANVIDGLLKNPSVRQAALTGQATPLSLKMLAQAEARIETILPREVVAAEQRAAVGYYDSLEVRGELRPTIEEAPAGIRAEAGGGKPPSVPPLPRPSSAPPARTTSSVPPAAAGTTQPRTPPPAPRKIAAPRGVAPEEAAAAEVAAAEAPAKGDVVVKIIKEGVIERFRRRWKERKTEKATAKEAKKAEKERKTAPPPPKDVVTRTQEIVDDALDIVSLPDDAKYPMLEAIEQEIQAAEQRLADLRASKTPDPTVIARAKTNLRELYEFNSVLASEFVFSFSRVDQIVRSLFRASQDTAYVPENLRQGYFRNLLRLYAREGVRELMRGSADPEMKQIVAVIEAALRKGPGGRGHYIAMLAKQPVQGDIVAQAFKRAITRRVKMAENLGLLEQRRLEAKQPGAKARLDAEIKKLRSEARRTDPDIARADRQGLERILQEEANYVDLYFGLGSSATDRATFILDATNSGTIGGDTAVVEYLVQRLGVTEAMERSARALEGTASLQTAGRMRVFGVIRDAVLESAYQGGDLESTLTGIMKSDAVVRAVGESYGADAMRAYQDLIASEGVTLEELVNGIPGGVKDPVATFINGVNTPEMADSFTAVGILRPKAEEVTLAMEEQMLGPMREMIYPVAPGFGRGLTRAGQAIGGWGKRQFTTPFSYLKTIAAAPPETRFRVGMRNLWMFRTYIPTAIVGVGGYMLYRSFAGKSVDEGMETAKGVLGIEVARNVADWISTPGGKNFVLNQRLQNKNDELRITNEIQLLDMLSSPDSSAPIWVSKLRANDLLAEGMALDNRMTEIGRLQYNRSSEDADEATRSEEQLRALLKTMGITLEAFDKLMGKDMRLPTIEDLIELKRSDWVAKGILVSRTYATAELLLLDCGMKKDDSRLGTYAKFLSENPEALYVIWKGMADGNIPVLKVDDAISRLMSLAPREMPAPAPSEFYRPGVKVPLPQTIQSTVYGNAAQQLEGCSSEELRAMVQDQPVAEGVNLDNLVANTRKGEKQEWAMLKLRGMATYARLKDGMLAAGIYVEVPSGETTVSGIRQDSLLGMLERTALESNDKTMLDAVEKIIDRYADNPAALAKFNSFTINADERIYGDPAKLAELVANGGTVEQARKQGFVAPVILAATDPDFLKEENRGLVVFAVSHSKENWGVLKWVADNQTSGLQGGDLSEIVAYLQRNSTTANMKPNELYSPGGKIGGKDFPSSGMLVQQRRIYEERGWLMTQTPVKKAELPADTQEYPRPAGAVGEQRGAAPAPVVLSEPAKKFLDDEKNAELKLIAEGAVSSYYEDKRGNGKLIRLVYKEEQEKAKTAFDGYLHATITDPKRKDELAKNGIMISETGEVTVSDFGKAGKFLRQLLFDFLKTEQAKLEPKQKGGG